MISSSPSKKPSVLIIEQDPGVRSALKIAFNHLGYDSVMPRGEDVDHGRLPQIDESWRNVSAIVISAERQRDLSEIPQNEKQGLVTNITYDYATAMVPELRRAGIDAPVVSYVNMATGLAGNAVADLVSRTKELPGKNLLLNKLETTSALDVAKKTDEMVGQKQGVAHSGTKPLAGSKTQQALDSRSSGPEDFSRN